MIQRIKKIQLPKIVDERGNLSFLENGSQLPFEVKRAYWIYDVPGGEKRGGHAYMELDEVVIALSGSFDVVINEGDGEKRYVLNRSYDALYIPHLVWRSLENFSTNSLALILASTTYNERDYIRDFNAYLKARESNGISI